MLPTHSERPLLLIAACVLLCSGIACHDVLEREQPKPKVPSLFDFGNYQQLFAKHYGSHLEAVTRRVYFLANAFKVYVSGVAYKFWRQRHYLALNEMSDWSPQELDKMLNRVLAGRTTAEPSLWDEAVRPSNVDPAKVAEALEGKIIEALDESSLPKLIDEERHRQKRDAPFPADEVLDRPPRRISLSDLIKSDDEEEPIKAQARVNNNPKSNNPNYEPASVQQATTGLHQQEKVDVWSLPAAFPGQRVVEILSLASTSAAKQVTRLLGLASNSKWAPTSLLPDVMYLDLRDSGCFFEPRHQGKCGACYAFASIAMMEYLYCNKTGELVAFSEQYMLDCGNGRVKAMDGCIGGAEWSVPNFIHNFGMELASHYPYLGRESECPYSDDTDLKKTGFIRMELKHLARVHASTWPKYLKFSPLYVLVAVTREFLHYGGGVVDGENCPDTPNHAMLVVGHGREDGREFWLMRNSHGVHWGDRGYYKLSKSAPKRCIQFQEGFAFGTKDGTDFIKPVPNDSHALKRQ